MALAFGAALGSSGGGGSASTTLTVTTGATVPAGGRIFIVVGWYHATATAAASGGGLTWVSDGVRINTTTANYHTAVLSADAPSGLASGTVLTVTFSVASDNLAISCFYATGATSGASGYLDGTAVGGNGTTTAHTTASLATSNADDILVGGAWIDNLTSDTATGSFAEVHDFQTAATGTTFTSMYRIVAATGSYAMTGTWAAAAAEWTSVMAGYKAAAGGAVTSTRPRSRMIRPRSVVLSGARFAR